MGAIERARIRPSERSACEYANKGIKRGMGRASELKKWGASEPNGVQEIGRTELYRVLADEERLKVLALVQSEALTVGELASILGESQPQTSKRTGALRRAGLLEARKEGTRTFLSMREAEDVVVKDALEEGRRLSRDQGLFAKVSEVVLQREELGKELFEEAEEKDAEGGKKGAYRAHLRAIGPILPQKELCVDVGCGEGAALDVLAPLYRRVIAVDRSRARLARCATKIRNEGYGHVSVHEASLGDVGLVQKVDEQGGADLVFAGRLIHHASRPKKAVQDLARLCKPGGAVAVLEYHPHEDEKMRAEQGDVWLGIKASDIEEAMEEAGVKVVGREEVPKGEVGEGPDSHLHWHVVVGVVPERPREAS